MDPLHPTWYSCWIHRFATSPTLATLQPCKMPWAMSILRSMLRRESGQCRAIWVEVGVARDIGYSLCKHGFDLNLESILPVLAFFPNSWLPLARIVSVTLVIHSYATALLKPDPNLASAIQGFAPGQVAAYNMHSPTCKTRAGRVVLASKRMWAIRFNGEATAEWMGSSHLWLLSCLLEGDPSQRRLIRGSINEVPTMQLKQWGRCCIICVFLGHEFAPTGFWLICFLPLIKVIQWSAACCSRCMVVVLKHDALPALD